MILQVAAHVMADSFYFLVKSESCRFTGGFLAEIACAFLVSSNLPANLTYRTLDFSLLGSN
jgi:hypothetical protein